MLHNPGLLATEGQHVSCRGLHRHPRSGNTGRGRCRDTVLDVQRIQCGPRFVPTEIIIRMALTEDYLV